MVYLKGRTTKSVSRQQKKTGYTVSYDITVIDNDYHSKIVAFGFYVRLFLFQIESKHTINTSIPIFDKDVCLNYT